MVWFWFRWVIRLWLWIVGFRFGNWLWFWVMNLFKFERVKDGLNINSGEMLSSKGLIKEVVFLLQLVLFHHILTVFFVMRLMMMVMLLFSRLRFRVVMRFWLWMVGLRFWVVIRLWFGMVRLRFWMMIRFRFWMVIRLRVVGLWVVVGLWMMVWLWVIWFHLSWESWPVEPFRKITERSPRTIWLFLSLNFWSMKIMIDLVFNFW